MTNTSKLKMVGIGLVIVGLGSFILAVGFIPRGGATGQMEFAGWLLPTIGLGCYARAKERSAFWAAMGVVPILGPILAFVAIGIDDGLSKRAAPRWVRRVVRVGFALSVPAIFLAIVIPNFLLFSQRLPQAEAREVLRSIYYAEKPFTRNMNGTARLRRSASSWKRPTHAIPITLIALENPGPSTRRKFARLRWTTCSSMQESAPMDRASPPPPRPISMTIPPLISGT